MEHCPVSGADLDGDFGSCSGRRSGRGSSGGSSSRSSYSSADLWKDGIIGIQPQCGDTTELMVKTRPIINVVLEKSLIKPNYEFGESPLGGLNPDDSTQVFNASEMICLSCS